MPDKNEVTQSENQSANAEVSRVTPTGVLLGVIDEACAELAQCSAFSDQDAKLALGKGDLTKAIACLHECLAYQEAQLILLRRFMDKPEDLSG